MKVVILAGGYGTRLSEETSIVPKPLVEIGGKPILWHIMKLYAHHGLDDFVICCGYKGALIKDYFTGFLHRHCDFTIDLSNNSISMHHYPRESWRVTLVDTGENTMTGGRIKRVADHLNNSTFCLTYGDGLGDIDISALVNFHRQQGALATVTAVQLPGRFGAMNLTADRPRVASFREKSKEDAQAINGGFFVVEPEVLHLIDGDATVWEQEPMNALVDQGQLAVYRHPGYWQNMDTLRDKMLLQEIWESGSPPWRVWHNDVVSAPNRSRHVTGRDLKPTKV